jgi:plasmid stabilization system protein ParE
LYTIKLLLTAINDINEITSYITNVLNNRQAANNLVNNLIKEYANIQLFPHGNTIYKLPKSIKNSYYKTKVNNYLVFYNVNDKEKVITIARIIYQKRKISSEIKSLEY